MINKFENDRRMCHLHELTSEMFLQTIDTSLKGLRSIQHDAQNIDVSLQCTHVHVHTLYIHYTCTCILFLSLINII